MRFDLEFAELACTRICKPHPSFFKLIARLKRKMSDPSHHSTQEPQGSLSLFHPLSVMVPEWLSYDNSELSPLKRIPYPGVIWDDCIYVRDVDAQLLKFPLKTSSKRKSWTPLKTPEEATTDYALAVYSNNLVLVGGRPKGSLYAAVTPSNKVWIRNRTTEQWEDNHIPPVPWSQPSESHFQNEIMSAIEHHDLLVVLYKTSQEHSSSRKDLIGNPIFESHIVFFSKSEWNPPCKGPPLELHKSAHITIHNNFLYTMVYDPIHSQRVIFFRAQISSSGCEINHLMQFAEDASIFGCPSLTILDDKLIVTELCSGNKLVLYTPFTDFNGKHSLVDIDELKGMNFESIECTIGLSDKSLLVIGQARKQDSEFCSKSSVIRFDQRVIRYDGNKHLTLEAFKKLERGADIPVLTGHDLTGSKLEGIMEYLEFALVHSQYRNAPLAIQYIESWIYQNKGKKCNTDPTWSNLFAALKHVQLDQLVKDIEKCLMETLEITQPEIKKVRKHSRSETEAMLKATAPETKKSKTCTTTSSPMAASASSTNQQKSQPKLERSKRELTPTLHELDLIKDNGVQVQVIGSVSAKWDKLATRLYFSGNAIETIKRSCHFQPEDCCRKLFTEWLDGKGRQPKTWNTVIDVLKEAQVSEVAKKLVLVVSNDFDNVDEGSQHNVGYYTWFRNMCTIL